MSVVRLFPSLVIAAVLVTAAVDSQCSASDCAECDAQASECRCPLARICSRCGNKVCVTTASPAKETRTCWEVECVEVCIPAVRFPWDCCSKDGCGECAGTPLPRCGKVRCVRKLKPVEYECDTCEYDHQIVCRCPNCGPMLPADCLPPHSAASVKNELQAFEQAEAQPDITPPTHEIEAKPRWSGRFFTRLTSDEKVSEEQPRPVVNDLSQFFGHSRSSSPATE